MKILISPTIREPHKSQFEYTIDKKWVSFLSNIFGDIELVLPEQYKKKIDLIILCGGNDLVHLKASEKDLIRYRQDKKLYEYAIKENIPLIGICYGAQFIAEMLDCKLGKIKKHVGDHFIQATTNELNLFEKKKKIIVNSFHDYGIIESSKKIIPLALAADNTIELFKATNLNFLGIMWHPERFNKIKKIDKEILLNFCNLI
tara:strand:- start:1051 stop:1656 length:606 start_codon:yes stop_codon:yes gene_type:complete